MANRGRYGVEKLGVDWDCAVCAGIGEGVNCRIDVVLREARASCLTSSATPQMKLVGEILTLGISKLQFWARIYT